MRAQRGGADGAAGRPVPDAGGLLAAQIFSTRPVSWAGDSTPVANTLIPFRRENRPIWHGFCFHPVETHRAAAHGRRQHSDDRTGARKSVVAGKSVAVRVDLGGSLILKKTRQQKK